MIRYLLDEHALHLARELRRKMPELFVIGVGEDGAPSKGTDDPNLLTWCEEHGFILVTNDKRTLRAYFAQHLAAGRHSPGVLYINPGMAIGEILWRLEWIARIVEPGELADHDEFLGSV